MFKGSNLSDLTSLFTSATPQIVRQLKTDTLFLQSTFCLGRKTGQQVHVVLTSRYFALSQKAGLDHQNLYYTPLDFELKFQVIFDRLNPENETQNSNFSKPIGFRLFKTNSSSVEFTNIHNNILPVWLKYLAKLLNQNGFHNLFKPIKKLGKGGFATVYEVQRIADRQKFAVKAFSKMNTLNSNNVNHRKNLLNEIALMRSIENSNLIKLQGVYESDNSLYVVLELLSDGHLHNTINTCRGKFTEKQIKHIILGLAKGLKELHSHGIMHRDIKPENIMMRKGCEPVLVDFGLAARAEWNDYVFYRCGTPGYVAPEVTTLQKGQKISPVCDIFSVGVIFHILLTARPLFQGRRFQQVYENNKQMRFNLDAPQYQIINPEAMDLLRKMLKIRPSERITAAEILEHPYLAQELMAGGADLQSPLTIAPGNA